MATSSSTPPWCSTPDCIIIHSLSQVISTMFVRILNKYNKINSQVYTFKDLRSSMTEV